MFATSFQLMQLAFGNVLNGLYSALLLLIIVGLVLRGLNLRQGQSHWEEHWQKFLNTIEEQFNSLTRSGDAKALLTELPTAWLGDLSARIRAHMPLPEPAESIESMLSQAFEEHPLLDWEPEAHTTGWRRLPGVAILLGLLGTFFGLTAALTQLPVQGGLKELTGGLQQVLPLMGTAFWTSVCGLIASLLIRLVNATSERFAQRRFDALTRLQNKLQRRLLHELYPRLTHTSGLAYPSTEQAHEASALQAPQLTEEGLSNAIKDALLPLLDTLKLPQTQLQTLLDSFAPITHEFQQVQSGLHSWKESLAQLEGKLQQITRAASESLEPIAHTERLLSERVAAFTREHQALNEAVLQLEQHERQLPNKIKEILKGSLRPAHQLIQRANVSLSQLLEQHIERQSKDREEWRRLMSDLGDRFGNLERILHTNESMTHELQRMTDTLLGISTQLQFNRPESLHGQDGTDPIEAEIEQILDGIDVTGQNESSSQLDESDS